MLLDLQDHDGAIDKISREMINALNQRPSSMPMLPTYLSVPEQVEENKPVIVLDAGGTNLRVALVTIRKRAVVVESFAAYPMPGTYGPLDKEGFFDAVAEIIIPLCPKSDVISFCFSYLTQPLSNHDAQVVMLCKEICIEGIEGAHVCAELAKAMKRRGITKEFEFYLLNDSAASVLGGISGLNPRDAYDGIIGLIWGTGFNICYAENTEKISSAYGYPFHNMLINTEAGDYDGFEQGEVDAELDRQSMQPGLHKAEKMIGGGYLGDVIARMLHACVKERLLPDSFMKVRKVDLRQVNQLLSENAADFLPACTDADVRTVREIICAVYRRAAGFVACMLTAVAERVRENAGEAKIAVIADGSTLVKSEYLMNTLQYFCNTLCAPRKIHIDLIPSSRAILEGTAYAALLRSNQGFFIQEERQSNLASEETGMMGADIFFKNC